jgi:serine/threonine protein kinase
MTMPRTACPDGLLSVGAYDLLEKIGEGGMGVVWKGRWRRTGETVAIKLMMPGADKHASHLIQRFEQEFKAGLRLDHPNIVKVLDFGAAGELYYLVMELVEGRSLGARVKKEGRLPEAEAVHVIRQIATGLHQAHQVGLVHRDIKPDNILLAADGQAKLTDLGLVKVLDADIDLTSPNSGLGTPNYMAPEQFDNAKHADPRFDIYSLGATLYVAVTGQVPFKASTPMAVLKKKFACDVPAPRSVVPDLSERVERTILRAMNLDVQKRHESCEEFIADLAGKTGPRAGGVPRPSGKDRRRHPRLPSRQQAVCKSLGGHEEDTWKAQLNDVSQGGLSLTMTRRFEVGTVLLVTINQPKEPRWLYVRVVRQQPQPGRKWLLGCMFAKPIREDELQGLL